MGLVFIGPVFGKKMQMMVLPEKGFRIPGSIPVAGNKTLLLRVMEMDQFAGYRIGAGIQDRWFSDFYNTKILAIAQVITKIPDKNKGVVLANGFPIYISDLLQMIMVYNISTAAVELEQGGWIATVIDGPEAPVPGDQPGRSDKKTGW